jgi:lauroyl/myristoyl acyltransferase
MMAIKSKTAPPEGGGRADPLITGEDVLIVIGLGLLGGLGWIVPPQRWQLVGRALSPALRARNAADRSRRARLIAQALGARTLTLTAAEIDASLTANALIRQCLLGRFYRPGGWSPRVDLIGREHLDEAVAAGKGAIVFASHFAASGIFTKMGLSRAGYPVVHLSTPTHGFSSSRFGRRFLNPIRVGLENRFLAERIVMSEDGSTAAVRTLRKRLGENAVVTIAVREKAHRPVVLPFLDAWMPLGTGAPDLAYATGAALLPAFTTSASAEHYTVQVDAPIEIDRSLPRREASRAALVEYVRRLEPHVLMCPEQWQGWSHLVDAPGGAEP